MNNLEFAKAMVRYEELHQEMKALEEQITAHVMNIGQTQSVGNVQAKYTNGRTEYDYTSITSFYPLDDLRDLINEHSTMVEKIDWRAICKAKDFLPTVSKEPVPSVKIVVQ